VTEAEPVFRDGGGACFSFRRRSLSFVTEAESVFRDGGGACLSFRRRSLSFVTEAEPVFRSGGGSIAFQLINFTSKQWVQVR